MDREDISKRCVLFKNVPLQTCQSKFRLWLDHVESCAFRDLYLDVQPHIEDKYDKRWIVLFKQETDAIKCIETKKITVETETEETDIFPDYCSECIVPDEWLERSEDWVTVNKPVNESFSLLGYDSHVNVRGTSSSTESSIRSQDLFSENKDASKSEKAVSKNEAINTVFIQKEDNSVKSDELFKSGGSRPVSGSSVSSFDLFESGRNLSCSLGFTDIEDISNIGQTSKVDTKEVVSKHNEECRENMTNKADETVVAASIKIKDTRKKSQSKSLETGDNNGTQTQTSQKFDENSSSASKDTGSTEQSHVQLNMPIFPGLSYPYYPAQHLQSAEHMSQQYQPYAFQQMTAEGSRQTYFPYNMVPPVFPPMVPQMTNQQETQPGKHGQPNQENVKFFYVPIAVPSVFPQTGGVQGEPVAMMPSMTPGMQPYFPSFPSFPYMPFVPPYQQDQKKPAGDLESIKADDTYLTPVDSGAESKSANVSKRKGGLWTGIRSTDTPGVEAVTSIPGSPELDENGVEAVTSIPGSPELDENAAGEGLKETEQQEKDDEKTEKDFMNETIYALINETDLVGDKTLLKIKEKKMEKPPLPPVVQRRSDSIPLKPDQENRSAPGKSRITIINETSDTSEPSNEKWIKVKGIPNDVSKNHLELFIESKDVSDGAEVNNVKIFPEKQEAIIEMKYATDADRILRKHSSKPESFKFGKQMVNISRYIPPPVDPRKIFISGMKDGTSKDNLQNFIEVCCNHVPTTVEPGETPGTALLTFDKPVDLPLLREKIKQRSLEERFLEISEVEVTSRIKVKGYDPNLSNDALLYYFENRKRSGGGEVDRVEYQEENNVHIVHFLNSEDAVGACKMLKHEVNKITVTVSLYYPCLDLAPEYRVTKPEPLELLHLDPYIVRFLSDSSPYRMKFEVQLKKKCHASVVWPKSADEAVKIVCDLDPADRSVRDLIRGWQKSCQEEVDALCSFLDVNDQINVAKEVWDGVYERLQDMTFSDPDMVMIQLKRDDFLIIVFGLKEYVTTISQSILDIVSELEQRLSRERQTITKTKNLLTYQAALLRAIRFTEKIKTLSVSMDDRKVEFSGSKKDVDDCIQKMYKKLNEFACRHVTGYTKAAKDLLFQKETRSYLKKATNSKGLLCVWDVVKGSDLVIYSKTEKDLDQVIEIFQKSLKQENISLDFSMVKLTQSKEWESHVQQIRREYTGLISVELKLHEIQIVGVESVFQKVYDEVMKFFDLHGDISEFMKVEQGRFLYIVRNKKRELEEIEKQYQSLHVRVERVDKSNRKGFKTHGKKDGCRLAIKKLQDIVDNITYKDLTISLPGFKEFLLRSEGKLELQSIEISEKCILLPEISETAESYPSPVNEMTKEVAFCRIGQCDISVREGDITSLGVDMIVNPSQPSLSQSIGLGSALVDKGGFDIQRECSEHVRKNSNLMDADIFISKAGKLPCKGIIHVVLPSWRGGSNDERTILRRAVEHCLNGAVESNCHSLAIPALGAGLFGYPVDVAVRNIVEMIYRFNKDRDRAKSIDQIYLCDKKSEIVQLFIDRLKEKAGSLALKVYKDPDSSYSSGSSTGSAGSAGSPDDYNTTMPKITVQVGELVQDKADIIVNSTNKNLDLRIGIVSRGLVKAGGDVIQKECTDRYPSGIQIGEIAKTSGGALNCQRIYHGVLQIWDGGQGPAERAMGTFIQRCLEEADREKWRSIAFPALGTGNLRFPPEVVASLLFKCADEFQSTHLKEVRIILWHGDSAAVKAFTDAEKLYLKQQRIGGRKRYTSESFQPASVLLQNSGTPGKDFKTAIGNVSIEILQGDITRQKTGAIVNSVLKELNLSIGNVSKAILEAGGTTIQTECLANKAKLEKDGLVVTNPGKLLCQKIIHMKAKSTDASWKSMIYNCLLEVEKLGLNSVTFPALGTGGRGNTPEIMARLMMSSFRQYIGSKDFQQCLKSIRIVIYETNMLESFVKSAAEAPTLLPRVTSKVMDVFRPKSQVPAVKVHVYVDSLNNVENVKSKLEGLFKLHTIYLPKLLLGKMSDKEKSLIERKGALKNVYVTCSRAKGCIKLEGYGDSIGDVQKDIESYLKKLEKDAMQEVAYASVTLPKCWSKMTLKDPMKIEVLYSTVSTEYVRICNKFRTDAPNHQVVKIERIQNPTLFTQFIANKHQMEQANKGSSFPVERCLWHGTSAGAVESINKTGFNRNFNHGASHGVGVYFAVRASTSLSYCQPDPKGIRHMYYAHVLTGDCCVGSGGIRHPPVKQPGQSSVTYDSTTDNLQSPNFFVIFHDAKAYPSYHIEFL